MKSLIWRAPLLAISVLIMGCQGQNPLKPTANPVAQEYPGVAKAATEPYVFGQNRTLPKPPNNNQDVCYTPFNVSIDNDAGKDLMLFTENVPSTYHIHVISHFGDKFSVQAQLPAGATFKQIDQQGNTADYMLSWTPGVSLSSQVDFKIASLVYTSPLAQIACGQDIREDLNLAVLKSEDQPTVSFTGLPQTPLDLGKSFQFSIDVNDPASIRSLGPDLKVDYKSFVKNAERIVLDASKAVNCAPEGQYLGGTRWRFTCEFKTDQVADANMWDKSGKTLDAVFFATAESKRGAQKVSIATPVYVRVNFPKPDVSAQAATPAPEKKKEPAKISIKHKKKTARRKSKKYKRYSYVPMGGQS